MLAMYAFIISFFLIGNFLLFSTKIYAQQFQFTIPDNSIQFKRYKYDSINESAKNKVKNTNLLFSGPTSGLHNIVQITNQQQYLLKEYFDPNLNIKIRDFYVFNLLSNFPPAFSFDYLVDSKHDLLFIDEPIFYITLEDDSKSELILAKTSKQSSQTWQKVILDLSNYDLINKKLIFRLGSFTDQEQPTSIFLKNLSSQIIVWHDADQLLYQNRLINVLSDDLERGLINIANQNWPIYQFNKKEVDRLTVHQELDGSLTLLFSTLNENIFHNHRWFLGCDDGFSQQLMQKNHYLFPQLLIMDFWPNLTDRAVVNVQNFSCEKNQQLVLEVF